MMTIIQQFVVNESVFSGEVVVPRGPTPEK
jgi:hypothetical protein